jgi:hypothetical protein
MYIEENEYNAKCVAYYQWRTQEYFFGGELRREFFGGGGFQQIQLRTKGRENGDLGAVAP